MIKLNIKLRLLSILFFFFGFNVKSQNSFIENKGQFPENIKAKVNLPSGSLYIQEGALTFAFYSSKELRDRHDLTSNRDYISAHAYKMSFLNFNKNISTYLYESSQFYENYFVGEKSLWATDVRSFKSLLQKNLYNGIDIKYYVENNQLKYDLLIAPNANTDQIKILYNGIDKIFLDNKNLKITTSVNEIIEYKPYAYQLINNIKVDVTCYYALKGNELTFKFPNGFNSDLALIIDPTLEFSTYSGSTTDNFGYTATYDNYGFLYSGSTAFGTGYPTTMGSYQINYANNSGGTDIAITKYDTTGTVRIYSTYLGGSLDELPHSMIVNSSNELFIYGTTASSDFPTTLSAYQQNFNGGNGFSPSGIGVSFPNGSDLFVSRLSANGGNLLASTFLGGTGNDGLNTASRLKYNYADEVRGEIDIDLQNNIYIATCTQSSDFPSLNSFQNNNGGGQDGCVIKMDNQLTSIIWSTYLGGSQADAIYSLAIDNNNDIYVTGGTVSVDFPTSLTAYQNTYQDSINADGFVSKISSNGQQLLSSSYFGTSQYDQSYFVEIGSSNNIYLFGQTNAIGSQLVNNANYFVLNGSQFISVFNNDLTNLIRSTVIGSGKGSPDISPTAFLVDVCDKIYISGWGSNLGGPLSTLNLPISSSAFQQTTDGNDMYLLVLDDLLNTMVYATYFGGSQSAEHVDGGTSRFDKKGIIYQSVCAGCGGNSDFPIEPNPGAVSPINNSLNCNNGVFKFNFNFPIVIADFDTRWIGCDTTINFQNLTYSSSSVNYFWDFGDSNTSTAENPSHSYSEGGLYNITLIASDNTACNVSDTIVKEIYILSNSLDTIESIIKCKNEQKQIGLAPLNNQDIDYFWSPSFNLSSTSISNPFSNTDSTIQYQIFITNGSCTDTIIQDIIVNDLNLNAGEDSYYCNDPVLLNATFSAHIISTIWSSNENFTDTISELFSFLASSPSIFYVKVSDSICVQIDSVEVLSDSINIAIFGSDLCRGDSISIGLINQNQDFPLISYSWNFNNINSIQFIDSPDSSRWYSVEVFSIDSCVVKDSIFINVYEYPILDSISISDSIIFKGDSATINVHTSDKINWLDFSNNSLEQTFLPNESNCYYFEIFNDFSDFSCFIIDSVCIKVEDVFCDYYKIKIPNAFSPNNDEINDLYFIDDKDKIVVNFKIEIFNRIGQKVFSSNNINTKWNGVFVDKKLPPQVFHFYLELECIGGKKLFHKGNITLLR